MKAFGKDLPAITRASIKRAKMVKPKAPKGPKMGLGAMRGSTGGRSDKLPVKAPKGAFVVPADVVSALGEGNSAAGLDILSNKFSTSVAGPKTQGMADGGVPIVVSDGEFIVSPADVKSVGGGNMDYGHEILNAFCTKTRADNIRHLNSLPEPKK